MTYTRHVSPSTTDRRSTMPVVVPVPTVVTTPSIVHSPESERPVAIDTPELVGQYIVAAARHASLTEFVRMNGYVPKENDPKYRPLFIRCVSMAHEEFKGHATMPLDWRLDRVARTMAGWIVWRSERPQP